MSANRYRILGFSLILYALWSITTYFLEGRILTLLRPEAALDRVIYTVVANILIGIVIAFLVIRFSIASGAASRHQLGFSSLRRTVAVVIIAGLTGLGTLIMLLKVPSLNPQVLLNGYAQVLTVSVAEIMVCWAAVGTSFKSSARKFGEIQAVLMGITAASIFFGVYHLAHSPPFNEPAMVLRLILVGVVTSLVYFILRDIYAAIAFHNFLGTIGVLQALNASGNLSAYQEPQYHLIFTALLSIAVLIALDIIFIRRDVTPSKHI